MAEFIDNHRHRKLMKLVRGKKKSFHDQYDKKKSYFTPCDNINKTKKPQGTKLALVL